MIKLAIPGIFVLFLLLSGCKKDSINNEDDLKSAELTDLKYGDHLSQTLDVYLPQNRTSQTRVIILIHGGFWLAGDKSEMTGLAKQFRDEGYASAAINYRLSHTAENNIHPAQVNDLDKAIEFVRNKSVEWNISTDHLALIGTSAGGHIALLYTYAYDTRNRVRTVISLAGPTDLVNIQNAGSEQAQVLKWFLGTDAEASPGVYLQASPVSHVKTGSKPTLLLHGKLDALVPYDQSLILKSKLDEFAVKNKLVTYENLGHAGDLNAVPNLFAECESWLAEY